MTMNMLATAATLSDHDLLARVIALAQRERESSVELVAHLGELDSRKVLKAKGYSSTRRGAAACANGRSGPRRGS